MTKLVVAVLFLAVAAFAGDVARGLDFYSVDVATNRVVRVNAETGAGTPLVDIGIDVVNVDLVCTGGYLHVLLENYYEGIDARLVKVDLVNSRVVSTVTVTQDGRPIPNAEGLAAFDGRLLIAYCGECALEGPWSNAIGELAESGAITPLYDYLLLDPRHDADGLAALPNGHLLSMDLYYNGDNYRLSELVLPPDEEFITRGVHSPVTGMNDLAVLDNGDLWAVDPTDHSLKRLGPDGGILESRPYDPSLELFGLAGEGCGDHPTPTTLATWGRIKATYR
jgi:hypothetical protein